MLNSRNFLHSKSVRVRLLVSVGFNGVRAILSFLTGLLIARALNPSGYGDFTFLIGSFVAIRSLLDLGSSNAFYTFLSQRTRGSRFYLLYFAWLTLQFVVSLIVISCIIPASIFDKVWLGHSREIVLLAFLAAFMQQQLWQTVGQIGESMRKTVKVQLLNLSVAIAYLILVILLSIYDGLSLERILLLLIAQYVVATLCAYLFLKEEKIKAAEQQESFIEIFREYHVYCKPLIYLALVSFLYAFADKWMLQKFGGAMQQGYLQIASQFSAVSLLATASILKVFWKEIAEAWEKNDLMRVSRLYHKVNRGLVMLGAILTGLLIPWSEEIITIFLGKLYVQAWPVLAIMLLYPIHQSMGQIGGTMLLASGHTQKFMFVSMVIMLISIPCSYLILAPTTGVMIPGMGLGAIGIAIKMVVLGIVSVNIQALIIARYSGWKFDWIFQVVGIPLMLGLGYLSKMLVGLFWDLDVMSISKLVIPIVIVCLFYLTFVIITLWHLPWLIGIEKEESLNLLKKFKSRFG